MFKMLGLSIAVETTEKSLIFPPKDTSLDSAAWNLSNILSKKNQVEDLTFPLLTLSVKISLPLTNKYLLSPL